jgi:hypothetical protein
MGLMASTIGDVVHRAPARNEARVVLEVDVMPSNGTDVCGQHVKCGVNKVAVYASELPMVRALVQTEADRAAFAAAEQMYENEIASRTRGMDAAQAKVVRERENLSPWQYFAKLKPGGMPPLRSMRVLQEVGAPDLPEVRQEKSDARLTEAVALLSQILAAQATQPTATKPQK